MIPKPNNSLIAWPDDPLVIGYNSCPAIPTSEFVFNVVAGSNKDRLKLFI